MSRLPAPGAEKLRILALFTNVNLFGAERSNLEVFCKLRDCGAHVLLMVPDAPWGKEIRDCVRSLRLNYVEYPTVLIPRRWIGVATTLIAITRASLRLMSTVRSFEPTHIHAFSQFSILCFFFALALSKTPLVYRCGDRPVVHNEIWRLTWRFIVTRARKIVAISRFIEHEIKAAGAPADRIAVIYNIPPTRLPETDDTTGIVKNASTVIFAGQLIENKGPHLLIDAFGRLTQDFPDARLLIAGRISEWSGDDWARELRARTMADVNLASRVRFLGFVEDVPALMANCLVHVVPTVSEEPLGNVVMEAKKSGVPSIVFPSGGLPEMIVNGVDGHICSEKSSAALETALRVYLANPERSAREGRAAQASLNNFGVVQFAERWSEVYETA